MKTTFTKVMGGLCAAGALCALTACGGGKSFTIEGTTAPDVVGMLEPSDTVVYVLSFNNDTLAQGRLNADGTFSLKGEVETPALSCLLFGDARVAYLVLEPGKIEINVGEEGYVTGTDQNDALSEYFTLADDIEQYYIQQLYSVAEMADSTEAGDSLRMLAFNDLIAQSSEAIAHLTDSIYQANRDNEVGLCMAVMQMAGMHSSEEVRQHFGDNAYLMASPFIQRWMEDLDNPQDDLFGPEFDQGPMGEGDGPTEWEEDDDADVR